MSKVLVIGGAGYVGSHQVKLMCDNGYEVVVVDNLNTGFVDAIDNRATFIKGDLRDEQLMDKVFADHEFSGVFHFAALSLVGESVSKPLEYFNNNVYGMQILLQTMVKNNVKNLVFSSTAATYGTHEVMPITEQYQTNPENPYGESKLIMERMIKWCAQAYDLNYVALRYFNVCGAASDGSIGENHNPETHLIPIVLQVPLGIRESISIYGEDYLTEDGTCIRDYIHVEDLCDAHLLAMEKLFNQQMNQVMNLGYGHGFSVLEIIEKARVVTNHPIPAVGCERRAGDPAKLIADSTMAQRVLGWEPKRDNIELIIKSAFDYHKAKYDQQY